jgi:hypothetical protein
MQRILAIGGGGFQVENELSAMMITSRSLQARPTHGLFWSLQRVATCLKLLKGFMGPFPGR